MTKLKEKLAHCPLQCIDGETLMDMKLPRQSFCVETLLPNGVSILGGAPKIGKSWLFLNLCVQIAKGEPIWNLPTKKGTVLYLCLEDTLSRIQDRLGRLTEDAPSNLFFATAAGKITDGLCEQISEFIREHPDTVFVAIDTFQVIREAGNEATYASDYEDVRKLKALAETHSISLLLAHHQRKLSDSDPLNTLSGTTGITGAMDAIFVLDVSRRNAQGATLFCTGRDIECREIELQMSKETCAWELVSDSLDDPKLVLPKEMESLISFMKAERHFSGGNTEFAEKFNLFSRMNISAKALKQLMNHWRYVLEDANVYFENSRSNGQRFVKVKYSSSASDVSDVQDASLAVCDFCVPFVPCVPNEKIILNTERCRV